MMMIMMMKVFYVLFDVLPYGLILTSHVNDSAHVDYRILYRLVSVLIVLIQFCLTKPSYSATEYRVIRNISFFIVCFFVYCVVFFILPVFGNGEFCAVSRDRKYSRENYTGKYCAC